MTARIATLLVLALAPPACGRDGDAPRTDSPIAAATAPGAETPVPGPKAPSPMPKHQVLVGGCERDCADAGAAVAGFLAATADPAGAERAERFLDSTTLVVDGEALGARWVAMWKELKAATRKAEIRDATRSLSGWTEGLSPDQVRGALSAGAKSRRVWTTEAEFEFSPPTRPPWTIRLRPRGLEWLIVEVRRAAPGEGTDAERTPGR
ncbi:MAG: hypothetical protein FJ087_06290 [Deltaproteobacteria bacterium]|nr:hypothetical protein [Deltaproteobacteria bacterium]